MKYEYDYSTVMKFYGWAECLPDDVDFVDYWYNLFLSQTKEKIESSIFRNINAFHWTRWKNDFERYVDGYVRKEGEGFYPELRNWYAHYMQCLVYAYQISSKSIAEHYGRDIFVSTTQMFYKYHCYGIDYFIRSFADKNGLPADATDIVKLGM